MIIDLIDKLADRVIQLLTYRKQQRAALLQEYVTPVFNEFEKVHAAYLESFARYRELIQSAGGPGWIKSLQAQLEKDNLFSANTRSKVVRLAEAEQDDTLQPFITGISEYLMGARLVDSLGKQTYPHMVQRWRQSLFGTLTDIDETNWQMVLDPNASMPPMSEEQIDDELKQILNKYQDGVTTTAGPDELKRACALNALDAVVREMQYQYDNICQNYVKLKTSLS